MTRGYTLLEMAVTLGVLGVVTTVTYPRWHGVLDRVAVERAAAEVTTALAVARTAAVLRATRARLTVKEDSLWVDEWRDTAWVLVWRTPGPALQSVSLAASSPIVVFGPTGLGWGASNTAIVLERGGKTARITTSRIGRVKRW
jgi:prepilin-type N-terminal cleavage/methylation domain-containing protein